MSLHFDFAIACDLKPDTPQQILDTLSYMTRVEEYAFSSPPSHPFFEGDSWRDILLAKSEQTYLPGDLISSFRKAYRYEIGNEKHYRYNICFRCFLTDDAFYGTWLLLAEWLLLHSETDGYVGYYREEFSFHPTLIYFHGDAVCIYEMTGTPTPVRN